MGKSRLLRFESIAKAAAVLLFFTVIILAFAAMIRINGDRILYRAAKEGSLDLTGELAARREGLVSMQGEWEYYPNQLLYPEDFQAGKKTEKQYTVFPSLWKDDKKNFSNAKGEATYRLKVKLPEMEDGIGIYSRFQYGAYRIFLNGKEIAGAGKVSEDPSGHYVSYRPDYGYLNLLKPEQGEYLEIILQIQNYSHRFSGFSSSILIGSSQNIDFVHDFLLLANGMTGGFLIILFAYFSMVFLQNREKKEYANFSIVALMSAYICFTSYGESICYNAVPYLPSDLLFRMEYLALIIASFFANYPVVKQTIKNKWTSIIMKVVSWAVIACIILLPVYELSALRFYLHFVPIAFFFVSFYVAMGNALKVRTGTALLEVAGITILMLGVILNKTDISPMEGLDIFSIMVCIYCFTQIKIFLDRYSKVEEDLKKLTGDLESKIAKRTEELTIMKEKAESATEAKSQFLASMSHEIRTPMNAILGMSDLIRTDNFDKLQKDYFNDIRSMSKSLMHIINDILDFSRIESGKFEIIPVNYSVYQLLDNICSMMHFSAVSNGLFFIRDISPDLPDVLYGDEIRVRQIITNLVNNAIKYTKEGFVKFSAFSMEEDGKKQLCFQVEDSGIGIRQADIDKLFLSFEQLDSRKNRGVVGTGLGLVVCKELAALMNGRIEVSSEYGKGSCFTAMIPLILGDESKMELKDSSGSVHASLAEVLVVDDNPINLKVAIGMLKLHDILPETAESGKNAIEKIKSKAYDMVFMDHMMPEMDGVETTNIIRSLGEEYKKLPVIALTANAVAGTREMLIEAGMNDFLSKPIEGKRLNRILMKWLPKEKITYTAAEESSGAEEQSYGEQETKLLNKLAEIKGLQVREGLFILGGKMSLYVTILNEFIRESSGYLCQMQEYCEIGDWNNYSTVVHGIKSNLKTVGAMELAQRALDLENASREEDVEYCLRENNMFAKQLKQLSEELKRYLEQEEAPCEKEKKEWVQLKELIVSLTKACEVGDCSRADTIGEQLKRVTVDEETDKVLESIIRDIAAMEYEAVLERLEGIRK